MPAAAADGFSGEVRLLRGHASRGSSQQSVQAVTELAERTQTGNDENCTAHRCPNQYAMEVTSWLFGLCHTHLRADKVQLALE